MTTAELLTYANEIEYRALAVQTNVLACFRQLPLPPVRPPLIRGHDFVMSTDGDGDLWALHRPERPPVSDGKIFAAGFAFGLSVSAMSATLILMLVKT